MHGGECWKGRMDGDEFIAVMRKGKVSDWCIWLSGFMAHQETTPVWLSCNLDRNEKRLAHLWKLEGAKERLQLAKAELTVEGSFDNAIIGCAGVFHTASPVLGGPTHDPKAEILKPAIDGTLNVLRSCKRNPSLRRVVLTSSSSTVRASNDFNPNVPLDESSWSSVELSERLEIWYVLSKTLAEKAAWEFCKENKIDLVTVLPSFVIGPSLPPDLCSTAVDVLGLLKGETIKFQWHGRMGYIHIDDAALCHILVYVREEARRRCLCSSTVLDNDELTSILSPRYPTLPIPKRFDRVDRPYYELDTSRIKNLGFKFKSIPEMFDDCYIFDGARPSLTSLISHHLPNVPTNLYPPVIPSSYTMP